MTARIKPSGRERTFGEDELIVSKTDTRGRITYCNHVFTRISGFTEAEMLDQPHSIIRHPDMPRSVFKVLWDNLAEKREVFAYVVNIAKNGDHYWVLAHVTPSFDANGKVTGYHSNRRVPRRSAVAKAEQLYRDLRRIEQEGDDRKAGMARAVSEIEKILASEGKSFNEYVLAL